MGYVSVFAAETSNAVVTAMTTGLTTIASDCKEMVSSSVPIALPILGMFVMISLGIKVFKRVTGR